MFNLSLFAERLNELFFDNNTNVIDVEKLTDIPKSTLYRYLKAETIPSVAMLIKLAEHFNCSIDYLIGIDTDNYYTVNIKSPPFSERFHFLLKKFEVSKYKLNKELGLPDTSLYNWQNGKREPSIESIMKLAEYFNCSIDYIVGREN